MLLAPRASHATPLLFTLDDTSKPQIVTFELDSNPTPTTAYKDGFVVTVDDPMLNGVSDPELGTMSFSAGQFYQSLTAPNSRTDITAGAYYGGEIFGSGSSAGNQIQPYFYPETLTLVDEGSNDDETLTISALSAAPEPSTWALMIAGLGVMGLALRHRASRTALG